MKTYLSAHFGPFKIKLRTYNITWKLRVKVYIQLLHKFKESDKNNKIHSLAECSFHTLNKSWEKREEKKKKKKKSTGLLPETFRTWNEPKSAHRSCTTHRSWITVTSKHPSKWDQHKSLMASSDILDLCIFSWSPNHLYNSQLLVLHDSFQQWLKSQFSTTAPIKMQHGLALPCNVSSWTKIIFKEKLVQDNDRD